MNITPSQLNPAVYFNIQGAQLPETQANNFLQNHTLLTTGLPERDIRNIQVNDNELLGYVEELIQENEQLRMESTRGQELFNQVQAQIIQLQNTKLALLESKKQNNQNVFSKLNEMTVQRDHALFELNEKNREEHELNAAILWAREEFIEYEEQVGEYKKKLNEITVRLEVYERDNVALFNEKRDLENQIAELQNQNIESQRRLEARSLKLNSVRLLSRDLGERCQNLEQQYNQLSLQRENLERQNVDLSQSIENTRLIVTNLETELNDNQLQIRQLEGNNLTLHNDGIELQANNQALVENYNRLNLNYKRLQISLILGGVNVILYGLGGKVTLVGQLQHHVTQSLQPHIMKLINDGVKSVYNFVIKQSE